MASPGEYGANNHDKARPLRAAVCGPSRRSGHFVDHLSSDPLLLINALWYERSETWSTSSVAAFDLHILD
jgi:hypothetical protein